jgi:DNA adenine methylase
MIIRFKKIEINNINNKNLNSYNNMKFNNVSPLRYPGGKTRACTKLDSILTKYFKTDDIKTLISPFFGGGSFELFLQNKYNYDIICNDKFTPVYNFWNVCKTDKNKLCEHLYTYNIITKEQFTQFRSTIMNEENKLTQALQYFIINRCSFSGATLSGGFSKEASKLRFTKSSIDRIKSLCLTNFTIYNQDFEEFINEYYTVPNSILFLDPPYYLEKTSKLYGKNGDMHNTFDHKKLYDNISTKKNWLLTYNNCEYIRNLYKKFTILEVDWSYGMNKTKKSSEIVIISV